jgi:hypothetical protein
LTAKNLPTTTKVTQLWVRKTKQVKVLASGNAPSNASREKKTKKKKKKKKNRVWNQARPVVSHKKTPNQNMHVKNRDDRAPNAGQHNL